jgi:hypothetical protein
MCLKGGRRKDTLAVCGRGLLAMFCKGWQKKGYSGSVWLRPACHVFEGLECGSLPGGPTHGVIELEV